MSPDKPSLPGDSAPHAAGIYVHWPFCLKKCPYCDFNSHVRDSVDHDDWSRALIAEIDATAALYPNLKAASIFFGGGTPSLMAPETVAVVIERVRSHWGGDEIEITLEANPSSVEAGRFRAYREAGVNRLSMGIQSLRDDALQFLGRLHNASEALRALEVARHTFERVSFDLIYARPGMELADWRTELSEALAMAPSHLSLYQLTIEEGTAFWHQYRRGAFALPDEETAAALYDLTQDMTAAAGLPAYETSNHAAMGQESQHNLIYWRGLPYVGIGPGAHGRLPNGSGALATANIKRPEDWLKAVSDTGFGLTETFTVEPLERATEALMMGLRLMEGLDIAAIETRFGAPRNEWLDEATLASLVSDGFLKADDGRVTVTRAGQPVLNHLIGKLAL
ncbi:radical SAM family heme chaperone HemW [Gimibacter soli]|uniref:Heme chaperone HemW n=1 Tax=Gimibacter soli TaxID=3024400 RepID=A0AAF0BLU5_9PROT|nr:radical SAM family heme chaperone HemW [Gimibacter soli]WCL54572.1 radical SAM family heme chaperone HemW [Gimibacter soli]